MLPIVILAEGLTAFCALAFEIAMARLIAPYAGMSTDTWTAIIAAFLLALALGNRSGGRLAANADLRAMLALAAGAVGLGGAAVTATPLAMPWWDTVILASAPTQPWRIAMFAGLPCIPAGFFFGVANPLLMTAALALAQRASVAGPVYAAGAAGSVLGVLGVQWWLLDTLGTRATLLAIAAITLANGALIVSACVTRRRVAPA